MRDVLVLLVGLLPASSTKNLLLRVLGHRVAPTAHVAPCLLIRVRSIDLADGSAIGALSAFRGLHRLELRRNAVVGQLNWVSAAPFLTPVAEPDDAGVLLLEEEAAITMRHYVDASGGVRIGAFALLGGVRSVLLTHQIDAQRNCLTVGPIRLGRYSLVSSSTKIVMNSVVPAYSLVAMGSTVIPGLTEEHRLYAGVPAVDKGATDGDYFRRTSGAVLPRR